MKGSAGNSGAPFFAGDKNDADGEALNRRNFTRRQSDSEREADS
jgi:hypothetical protein